MNNEHSSNQNHIAMIRAELQKVDSFATNIPKQIGMLTVKTANQTIKDAALRPNPDALWLSLWYESEVCCLFSDSNLGKSIYAVQIGTVIAEQKKVLYFDFELSDKQFQLRYSDEAGNLYQFPDNLYRVEISRESLDVTNFEDTVIDAAGTLMLRLMALKRKYGLSILVLAHTPKRCLSNPITQNDLAGSKKLYNFFDSVFAIGKSAKDNNVRYIKQLKVRYGNYTYDSDNVIVSSIEKVGAFLQFVNIGYATEKEHLREPSDKDKAEVINEAKRLSSEGKSQREIARTLNLSVGCINKYLKM